MKKTLMLASLLTATSLYSVTLWENIDWKQFDKPETPPVTLTWTGNPCSLYLALENQDAKLLQCSFTLADLETVNSKRENPIAIATRVAQWKKNSLDSASKLLNPDSAPDNAIKAKLEAEDQLASMLRDHLQRTFNRRCTELLEASFKSGGSTITDNTPPPSH